MQRWKIAFLLIPAFLWGRLVFGSLWIDETLVYWSIQDGFPDVMHRVVQYQNQSPFYNLVLWSAKHLVGSSEAALRIPSVLAAIAACFAVYALASRLLGREAGFFAAFFFSVTDDVVAAATNVRNYSFAILFSTLSMLLLLRWTERPAWKPLFGFALSVVLMIYSHFFFAAAVPFQILFVLASAKKSKEVRSGLPHFFGALAAAAVALVPNWPQIELLRSRAQILSFAPMPGMSELALAIFPPHVLLFTAAGLLAAGLVSPRRIHVPPPARNGLVLLAAWWLGPPLLFFVASHLGGSSVFVSRYFAWAAPALALLLALLTVSLTNEKARMLFVAAFALVLLTGETAKYRGAEDWRGAASAADEILAGSPGPVLAATGLIEGQDLSWLRDSEKRGYILAPFSYYPLRSAPLPLPNECGSAAAEEYLRTDIAPKLAGAARVLALVRTTYVENILSPQYYASCLEKLGWQKTGEQSFERVSLLVFAPTGAAPDRPAER